MIFYVIQKNFEVLGISRTQSIYTICAKVLFAHLLLGSSIIFHFQFIYRADLTLAQYAQTLYVTLISAMSLMCYIITFLTKKKYFNHFDELEALIQEFNESESKLYFVA